MKTGDMNRRYLIAGAAALGTVVPLSKAAAQARQPLIYVDGIKPGWWIGGWTKHEIVDFDGQKPIRLTMEPWNALTFQTGTPLKADEYKTLTILVHGGDKGRQEVKLSARLGEKDYGAEATLKGKKGQWVRYDIDLKDLKITGDFDTIFINNKFDDTQPPFYINIVLMQ
ncbi:MAG: hypothetical protein QM645_04060 [Asticcacaulis sp.]